MNKATDEEVVSAMNTEKAQKEEGLMNKKLHNVRVMIANIRNGEKLLVLADPTDPVSYNMNNIKASRSFDEAAKIAARLGFLEIIEVLCEASDVVYPDMSDEKLLGLIDEERRKFTARSDERLRFFIDLAIELELYPKETLPSNPNNVYDMVDGWGAYWYKYKPPFSCPHCKRDLCDREVGPPFKREIGHSCHDRIHFWTCPDCKKEIK